MAERASGTLEGEAVHGMNPGDHELTENAPPGGGDPEYQIDPREPLVTRDAGELRLGPYEDSYSISRGYLDEEDLLAAEG